ncbi:hypothetical protein [Novosphingobium sp. Chol11]|uniref:hypothetical protein n=1 Tax=Novosphingobium sp. Chol11 TaxID=1385763 RepID=UPI0025CFE457|nr:hypothetical protein [Novosphingobium sp. Chol11]
MLHFAPRHGTFSFTCKPNSRLARRAAANDNGLVQPGGAAGANDQAGDEASDHDALLEAALRLFAAHGLSAAQRAHDAALIAERIGEPDKARWWMAICAVLDGGLARSFDRRTGGHG